MRIVCEQCGTKYSIPDDRVRNKPFKIRCKKCSNTIVVDGSSAQPAEEAVWYVVINGEQVGPITTPDVDQYFFNRQVDLETFIWRDGYPDWVQLSAIAEFEHLRSGGAGAAAAPSPEPQAADDEADSTRIVSMTSVEQQADPNAANNPFGLGGYGAAVAQQPMAEPAYAQAPAAAAQPGGFESFADFGAGAEAPDEDDNLRDLGQPAAAQNKGPRLTPNDLVGARSENSVLFSLSNLQAVSGRAREESSSSSGGVPTTEGSGLIDIKALAASHAAAPADNRRSFADEPADPVIPMPAMIPLGTRKSNTGLIIGIVAGAVVLLGLITVVLVLVLSAPKEQASAQVAKKDSGDEAVDPPELGVAGNQAVVAQNTATQPANAPVTDAGTPAPNTNPAPSPDPAAQPTDPNAAPTDPNAAPTDPNAAPTDPAADPNAAAKTDEPKTDKPKDDKPKTDKPKDEPKTDKPKDEPKTDKPKTDKPKDDKPKDEPKESSGGALTKEEVAKVIRGEFGKIRTCSRDAEVKGSLKVSFTIKGDGRVSGAKIASPEFEGTKVGSCVVKVVGAMRFRAGGTEVPVTYPFAIN